jgi:RNA polymerase sigma-70 factor (ECF subfamily)
MATDEQLALGVQQGNTAELARLVERHHSPLLGFLYRMTGGDRALAEDLVQEAFLRVLRAIGQYRYPRPFKPWLYAIAVNLTRDHFKRAITRHSDLPGDDAPLWESLAGDSPPDEGMLAADEARQVAAAIAALPAHQREAVILRYYQELSLAEIAEVLAVPVGTVKSRLTLGLRRLKAGLEDEHDRQFQRS